jgi:hypothetical protein
LALGDRLYRESCAACHGLEAKGVANLGNQLAGADFVSSKSDAELLDVIVKGRDLNDPENTTGLVMPRVAADPILVTRTCWPSSPLCARSLSARIPIKESPFVSTPITAIAHNASAAALYGVYLAGLRSTYGREYTAPVVHPAAVGGRRRKAQHSG